MRDAAAGTAWFVWGIAMFALALLALGGAGIVYQNTLGVRSENARTNVVRESRQYVETQQARALELIADHERLKAVPGSEGQQSYIMQQVRGIADRLGPDDTTAEMARFLGGAR